MEVVILGASGQLGKELGKVFPRARKLQQNDIDFSVPGAVVAYDFSGVDLILNAAAYTNVDEAETKEGGEAALQVNALALLELAEVAQRNKCMLVHYSSDYVFDGKKETAYTEEDVPHPLNVYGKTKLAGDLAVLHVPQSYVIRTSWVYGEGKNFVRTMLELSKTKKQLSVVSDQIGRPTFARDIALATSQLVNSQAPFGLYNFTNSGEPVSWAGFAREIFRQKKLTTKVLDILTADYSKGKEFYASRPLRSTLDLSKIEYQGIVPRSWKEALADFLGEKS